MFQFRFCFMFREYNWKLSNFPRCRGGNNKVLGARYVSEPLNLVITFLQNCYKFELRFFYSNLNYYFPLILHIWNQKNPFKIKVFERKLYQLHDAIFVHINAAWKLNGKGHNEVFVGANKKVAFSSSGKKLSFYGRNYPWNCQASCLFFAKSLYQGGMLRLNFHHIRILTRNYQKTCCPESHRTLANFAWTFCTLHNYLITGEQLTKFENLQHSACKYFESFHWCFRRMLRFQRYA